MADKTIGDLTRATAFSQSDLLVMEQNGQAKSVTGQVLMQDLAKMLDGHGGIKDIQKVGTVGLEDTYRITLSDGTKFEYYITNGRDGRDGKDGAVGERGPSGTPRNWLDNSDFHFAVNQRGEKNYVVDGDAPVDAIDRWTLMSYGSEMSVDAYQAVICRGMFLQNLSKEAEYGLAGKTVTVAVEDDYNRVWVASGSFSNGFSAASNGLTISVSPTALILTTDNISLTRPRIGLYEGEYTAETLPDYQYKGYASELMECQRYYRRYPASNILAIGYTDAEGKVLFSIPVSTEFRSKPVASELTGAKIIVDGDVITITDKIIPQVTSLDVNAVHFSMGNDFLLSDKPNKMVAISNVNAFELSA